MTRRPLADPPPVAELAELARHLAVEAPAALPAFLWCVVRSSRVAGSVRTLRPSGVHLAAIQAHPAGAALIESFRAGVEWRQKWTETSAVLDVLLPAAPYHHRPRSTRDRS